MIQQCALESHDSTVHDVVEQARTTRDTVFIPGSHEDDQGWSLARLRRRNAGTKEGREQDTVHRVRTSGGG